MGNRCYQLDKLQKKTKQNLDNCNWHSDHKLVTDAFEEGLEQDLEFSYVEYGRVERAYQRLRHQGRIIGFYEHCLVKIDEHHGCNDFVKQRCI